MLKGTVKWFNPNKGFGFIQPEDGGNEVFLHVSALERAGVSFLDEGQIVDYEIATNNGKTSVVNLKIA